MTSLMLLAVCPAGGPTLPALPWGEARAIVAGDLAGVVFAKPKAGLFGLGRDHLAKGLLDHQRGLEALQSGRALVPAVFGAEFRSETEVSAFLTANRARLHALIERYGLMREFRVTIRCVPAAQERLLAQFTPEGDGAALPSGHAARRLRLRLRAMLEPVARETLEMPTDGPDMLINIVVLIGAEAEAMLDATLATIDALAPDLLQIRCAGPLPACSFASVSSDPVSAARIETARIELGLPAPAPGESLADGEIRRAFLAQSRGAHPDAGGSPARFAALRESFALLRSIAGQNGAGQNGATPENPTSPDDAPPPLLRVVRADQQPSP